MKYATGKYAKAISDRSGMAFPYKEMRKEWNGSFVHQSEFEEKQMQKRPFSTYANQPVPTNLPRIQSELEVISEKEDSLHHKPNDMMIDESYSFSIR